MAKVRILVWRMMETISARKSDWRFTWRIALILRKG